MSTGRRTSINAVDRRTYECIYLLITYPANPTARFSRAFCDFHRMTLLRSAICYISYMCFSILSVILVHGVETAEHLITFHLLSIYGHR